MSEIDSQNEVPEMSGEKKMSFSEKAPETDVEKDGRVAHNITGLAVVEQGNVIPTTGERKITTRKEYWCYCLFGE